jgi:hypothetical protein
MIAPKIKFDLSTSDRTNIVSLYEIGGYFRVNTSQRLPIRSFQVVGEGGIVRRGECIGRVLDGLRNSSRTIKSMPT